MLILERIVTTNSLTKFIEARKESSVISPALLHPRPPKFTGNLACLHTSLSNDMLATLPREQKEPRRRCATPLYTSKQAMFSVHVAALVL